MGEGCPLRVGVCLKGDMIPSYWLVIFGGIWWSYISGILMVIIKLFFGLILRKPPLMLIYWIHLSDTQTF